jgi:DMSO reductase anchor subunit
MIGRFGWLDTPAPALTWVPWTIALGALVFAAVLWSTRRGVAVLLGLLAATIVVPVAIEAPTYADAANLTWQGRYTLPLAVGVPILAGALLWATERGRRLVTSRLLWATGIVLAGAQILAFGQNLRRYTVGARGPISFSSSAPWSPPLPRLALIVAFAVVVVAFVWWLLAAIPVAPDAPTAASTEADTPELDRRPATVTASPGA